MIEESKQPLVSIVIVNFNGLKWLKGCLDSAIEQDYPNIEILVVDNASTDGSQDFIAKNYPGVKLIQNNENCGFAKGNNIGIGEAKGVFYLLINTDTTFSEDLITSLIKGFGDLPNAAVIQPKMLVMDKNPPILDGSGSYFTYYTFLYHTGLFSPDLQEFDIQKKVFSVKGAAMFVRADVVEKIGLFDDQFWCYYEETDFCHRAWLSGYECWYYPKGIVYHAGGATSSAFENETVLFHNSKNKIRSFLKNFGLKNVLVFLSLHLVLSVGLIFDIVHKRKIVTPKSFTKALIWNIMHFNETMQERTHVQNDIRKKSDKDILNQIMVTPNFWRVFMSK